MTADTTTSPSGADDDPAFDIDPDGDAAAYDEWAAVAGEPARPPPEHPQRDFADNQASFAAIASSLTKTQITAASHPGSILVLAGAAQAKRRPSPRPSHTGSPSTKSRPIASWP